MKKITSVLIMALAATIMATAQTVQPAKSFQVFMKPVDAQGNSVVNRDKTTIDATTNMEVTYAIELQETTGISNIHVKLGTTVGGSEKAGYVIPFDAGTAQLPTGVTYERKGNVVYIKLGAFTGVTNYYSEVKLEDGSGNQSAPNEYSNL